MDGSRRGILPSLARLALKTASVPYQMAVAWRNRGFDVGRREICRVDVPVISVGNLTTGGTGKTPLVAFLADWFRSRGVRVSIVSRGYGRGNAAENDEAAELHQRLPDVPHVQDPDRVHAATIAVEELETELVLMDDGFQHRRLHRDLNLVLIDATCPFGYGHLLPRGLLREPVRNLRRADVIIITRCDLVSSEQVASIRATINKCHPDVTIVQCVHRPNGLQEFAGPTRALSELEGTRVALVCAIGNPVAFRKTVEAVGAKIEGVHSLPDHAAYERPTIERVEQWLRNLANVDLVVCTQKDLVKIRSDRLGGLPLVALAIDAEVEENAEFENKLAGLLRPSAP